jgi:hypothetical protein
MVVAQVEEQMRKEEQTRLKLICRVGQNRIYTPYMTVYLVISLPKIPYIHRIYMVLANPIHMLPTIMCTQVLHDGCRAG